jgi:hypothetical protein
MELDQLAKMLEAMGCPAEKTEDMAGQLDKRAKQLMELKSTSYEQSLAHLLAWLICSR